MPGPARNNGRNFPPLAAGIIRFIMKILRRLSFALVLIAAPLALSASPSSDAKIESTARYSYSFRTVLANQVKVSVNHGQVTVYGTVPDIEARALAIDTVENIPGVTGVTNNIMVELDKPDRSDQWMALKIRGRLLVMANVNATTTLVTVQDGIATLGGTAANPVEKELAGRYAGEIAGVKSVQNNIVVNNQPVFTARVDDASITSQVKLALLGHKSTSALKATIITNDGVVHVTGEAANDAEKSLVTQLAQDIRGTTSVANAMTIKG